MTWRITFLKWINHFEWVSAFCAIDTCLDERITEVLSGLLNPCSFRKTNKVITENMTNVQCG